MSTREGKAPADGQLQVRTDARASRMKSGAEKERHTGDEHHQREVDNRDAVADGR